jgi:hypothetical protein
MVIQLLEEEKEFGDLLAKGIGIYSYYQNTSNRQYDYFSTLFKEQKIFPIYQRSIMLCRKDTFLTKQNFHSTI